MIDQRPEFSATIGDTCLFAVKVDLDEHFYGEWLYGRIAYFIGGKRVGDYSLSTSLRDIYLHMYRILWDAGKRHTLRFNGLPAKQLFEALWSMLYDTPTKELEEIATEEYWVKHRITLPADVFEGVHIFQFDEGEKSRIIWSSLTDSTDSSVNEIIVPTGTVESVYAQLSELLEELSIWEEATRNQSNGPGLFNDKEA